MKEFAKKSIIYVAVIFLLFSAITTIGIHIEYKKQLSEWQENTNIDETQIYNADNLSITDALEIQRINDLYEVVNLNIILIIVAIIIGLLIVSGKLIKENSLMKVIFAFLSLNIIVNVIATSIRVILFRVEGVKINVLSEFIDTSLYVFIPYTIIFVIFYLVTGQLSVSSLAGPVGIYSVVGEAASAGFINLVYLTAFISLNVGFINFLPIPAFDGGRILFLIIEKIKGRPVDPKLENTIHSIGFFLLMALMILITYNDIIRLIG